MEGITAKIAAARSGAPGAMDQLFATCGERLLAYIRMRMGATLRKRVESRDILQATMLKAFTGLDDARAENTASMMAWLARIADNQIRDLAAHHHRQCRNQAIEVPVEQVEHRAVAEQLQSQTSRINLGQQMLVVARALDQLSTSQREVVLLRYFHELGFAEIGARMERSADACRMLLARAMSALTVAVAEDQR